MDTKRSLRRIFALFLTLVLALGIFLPTQVARAVDITVTTTTDGTGGPYCTLRDAIKAADTDTSIGGCPAGFGADTIILDNDATYILTIEGLPAIHSQITIEGNGSIIKRGSTGGIPEFRIFYISPGGDLTLNDLTVSNGRYPEGGDDGGGVKNWGALTIYDSTFSSNFGGAILTLEGSSVNMFNSTISENSGGGILINRGSVVLDNSTVNGNFDHQRGGGITNYRGSVYVYNSTISGNSATLEGGGIRNREGLLRLTNSTVSGNTTDGIGGGIYDYNGTVELTNTIVAAQLSGSDCAASVTSLGYNLDSDGSCNLDNTGDISNADPRLSTLRDNGGFTWTHALLEDSPAIDAVPTWECPLTTDQRGVLRPQGIACDIGAFELEQIEVDIDIKPGSDPSCFNNDGNGVIPVAILGKADFDVYTINPGTVSLEDLAISAKGKSNRLLAAYEDVNGDGNTDLVIKIEDTDGVFTQGSGTAVLKGSLYDGTIIFGVGDICITQ